MFLFSLAEIFFPIPSLKQTMSSEQEQVQVRFTTQQPEYAVNDSAILLPSNIKKEGLSEIVNSLLGLGNKIDLFKLISFSFFFLLIF
jgi:hypothetical protein